MSFAASADRVRQDVVEMPGLIGAKPGGSIRRTLLFGPAANATNLSKLRVSSKALAVFPD
jgi:hypothetical protein